MAARGQKRFSVLGVAFCFFPWAATITGTAIGQEATFRSELEFHSSDPQLNETFRWAKQQALVYVRPATSPVGEWYEAALPGRNAFCMRDVSHQTTGAAALGLDEANRNMLTRFALSAAPSRNWAGYWELDSKGQPSTADFRSDEDFWFNLPANFDVLDAIVRMWRWTDDHRYRNDPRLQTFFRRTLTDYVTQWQLQPDIILKRPRIANRKLQTGEFVNARGIPSYTEGRRDFILGADLLAAEYRAIRSYQEISASPSDEQLSEHLQKTADAIQNIIETVAWSAKEGHFHGLIQQDLKAYGSADTMILYYNASSNEEHLRGALNYVANPVYWKNINIEEESYVPAVLFRYGRTASAYQVLSDLSSPEKHRREYPEVSFSVIAAIVCGAMGIEPSHAGDLFEVQTLAHPSTEAETLSVASLQIRGHLVNVMHRGTTSSRLENRAGSAIRWKAAFMGDADVLYANGSAQHAHHAVLPGGFRISWIIIAVPPDDSMLVSRNQDGR